MTFKKKQVVVDAARQSITVAIGDATRAKRDKLRQLKPELADDVLFSRAVDIALYELRQLYGPVKVPL